MNERQANKEIQALQSSAEDWDDEWFVAWDKNTGEFMGHPINPKRPIITSEEIMREILKAVGKSLPIIPMEEFFVSRPEYRGKVYQVDHFSEFIS